MCPCRAVAARSCVTKIYANGLQHMLIPHIYIKVNRLLHCFLTPASIHDYLFRFLCKTAYKHGAGIFVNVSVGLFPVAAQGSYNCGWGLRHKRPPKEQGKPSLERCNVPWLLNSPLDLSPCYWESALLTHQYSLLVIGTDPHVMVDRNCSTPQRQFLFLIIIIKH